MMTPVRKFLLDSLPHSLPLRVVLYARNAWSYRQLFGEHVDLFELGRRFGPWQRSLRDGRGPLVDGCPWLTFGAIDFLDEHLTPGMTAFEYGSGGSTVFLASRSLRGVSIEHDEGWARDVRATLTSLGVADWDVRWVPAERGIVTGRDDSDPDAYYSSDPAFADMNFRSYVTAIEAYSDASFDLVSIDGRARPSCVAHAIPKVRPGGYLLLDQVERQSYGRAMRLVEAKGWRRFDFPGPVPYTVGFSATAIWRRPTIDGATARG